MDEIRYKPLPFSSNPMEWTFGCLMTVDNDMEAYAAAYNLRYEERRRLYYERYWARVDRRTWRRDTARKLTQPLAADGSAYRRRCLARKRRSR